jgi:hypothetical protein
VIPREYRSTTNDVDMLIEIHGLRTKEEISRQFSRLPSLNPR